MTLPVSVVKVHYRALDKNTYIPPSAINRAATHIFCLSTLHTTRPYVPLPLLLVLRGHFLTGIVPLMIA